MTDRKKRSRKEKKWISLDNMMGKALCILLVVILTVGAFLAPKMINNLYDAGTLMQITYMDLDLSTYAVAYTSFPEKIEAIARAKAAGEKLSVLSSEGTDEKLSDEELVEITNGEMEELKDSFVMPFWEEWWSGLSEKNLVSREKNTLYAQPGEQEGTSGSEMAPVQFWTLTFEINENQKVIQEEEYRRMMEGMKGVDSWPPFAFVSRKLIVCLDADFYKIYAFGIEGEQDKIWIQYEMYGWEFPDIFGMVFPTTAGGEYSKIISNDINDTQMMLTDHFVADWSAYWGVDTEDDVVYGAAAQGEIMGYMIFPNGEGEADDASGFYEGDGENKYVDTSSVIEYADWSGGDGMLLAVGCAGQWDGEDNELWIQRAGCREFFEMMQF
ncbi:hypothetical protein AALA90_18445 [Lachnospiraceae bacterium 38-10]